MNKYILLLLVSLITLGVNCQTLELGVGQNTNISALGNGDLGLAAELGSRYMFSPKMGVQAFGHYNRINSGHYECKYDVNSYKVSLEGVRRIIKLNKTVLLGSLGLGYGFMQGNNNYSDHTLDFVGGVSLLRQIKSSTALKLGFRTFGHTLQDKQFDNIYGINSSGINSYIHALTLGVVFFTDDFKKKKEEKLIKIIEKEVCCDAVAPIVNNITNIEKENIPVETVFFDYDKQDLKIQSRNAIYKVAKFLKENPKYNIIIEGWACASGSKEYNQKLSERRADVVYVTLISLGIDKGRIKKVGKGIDYDYTTELNHEYPRRVELKLYE